MPFDLNKFRTKFARGGARPSQFEMRITWPQQVPSGIAAAADFPFLCSASELPSSQVGNIKVPYFGRKLTFAGDRQFEDLTVTVLNDEDFKVKRALEAWSAAITGHASTVSAFDGGLNSGGYATSGEVRQYSRNDNGQGEVPIKAYRFIGLWPGNIGKIDLNWETENQIETFSVTFHYQWWESIDVSTGAVTVNL